MSGLRYYLVGWYHECDYPSAGIYVQRLVAAPDEQAARVQGEAPECAEVEVYEFGGLLPLDGYIKPFTVVG